MQHPNLMASPWFERPGRTKEQLLAEDRVGEIIIGNFFPFAAKVTEVEASFIGGVFHIRYWAIPASIEETRERWRELDTFTISPDDSEQERRVTEASQVTAELWQESWISGIPKDETIFCEACLERRPAHGSNLYDAFRLCNDCVGRVERKMARGELTDVADYVSEQMSTNKIHRLIRDAESKGSGATQLDDGRWLEFYPLYLFTRHSEYKDDSHPQPHWPYPDMDPTAYLGYVRSDWQPGQYFNARTRRLSSPVRISCLSFSLAEGN